MDYTFVLTGATGWVGRNFLHELQKIYPPKLFNENVLAFGSKRTDIASSAYSENQINIPIFPLKSIKNHIKNKSNIKIIHTAFLTKEKIKQYGVRNYISINKKITNCISELLDFCKNPEIVVISSGAARIFDKNGLNKNQLTNTPYEYLKFYEEEILSSKSNSLVLRIFALSGRFIKDPNLFAIGNFLLNAKSNESIKIESKNNVIRSYGFASDIANCAISWLSDKNKTNFLNLKIDAATHTLNLIDLANSITTQYSLPKVNENVDFRLEENNYSCDPNAYLNLLKHYNIKATSLSSQLEETMKDIT